MTSDFGHQRPVKTNQGEDDSEGEDDMKLRRRWRGENGAVMRWLKDIKKQWRTSRWRELNKVASVPHWMCAAVEIASHHTHLT